MVREKNAARLFPREAARRNQQSRQIDTFVNLRQREQRLDRYEQKHLEGFGAQLRAASLSDRPRVGEIRRVALRHRASRSVLSDPGLFAGLRVCGISSAQS